MKKSHLVFLISTLKSGGAERVISILANKAAEEGYKVSLITFQSAREKPFYPLNDKVTLIALDALTPSTTPFFSRIHLACLRLLKIRQAIKECHPQAVISFMDVTNVIMLLSTLGFSCKKIVSERSDPRFHTLSLLLKILRNMTYRLASSIVVQTKGAASYFNKAVEIIPNPVIHPSTQILNIRAEIKKIVTVGRLDGPKDHQTLIKAFSGLAHLNKGVQLLIYGEGPKRADLLKLINSLSLQERVFIKGPEGDVSQIYREADLFVFPTKYEGFPNVLCEALSYGVPVIASNCYGNLTIVKDKLNGRVFKVGDIAELQELISELAEDHPQRKNLSNQAVKISTQYSLDRIFPMWVDLFS